MVRRARDLRAGGVLAACWALLLLALLVGALGRWVWVVAVAGLGVALCEVALHRVLLRVFTSRIDEFNRLGTVVAELYARLPLEQALLLVFVVRAQPMSPTARGVVVVAVVLHQSLRFAHTTAGHLVARLGDFQPRMRGFPGQQVPSRPRTPLLGSPGLQLIVGATGLPALGLLWAAATGSYALVAPTAVAMPAVAAAVVAASAPGVLAVVRRPRGEVLAAVHDAVLRHRPEVVFYSSGDATKLNWVTSWLDTLDELSARGRRVLIVLRDPDVLDALPPAATPALCLPDNRDLRLPLPDTRVALLPNDDRDNFTLVRRFGLRTAFVGHGDSDKAASTRPTAKMYDEVWVAGEAGLARYLRADVGVRPEQVRIVGRPQARHIRRGGRPQPGAPWSVLYAPTWESSDDEAAGSSLVHTGADIVRRLLSVAGVRVLYRPHPFTGIRDVRFARADEEVRGLLARAGAPHGVVDAPTTDISTALNTADMLVTDVSSVATDFTASGKPYAVINGTSLTADAFRKDFPSTAGAAIVGRGGEGIEAAIADARGPDVLRAAREHLRAQLLGPPTDDPVALFDRAITELASSLQRPPGGRDGGTGEDVVDLTEDGVEVRDGVGVVEQAG